MLREAIAWLDEDQLSYQRSWIAEAPDGHRLTWTAIKNSAHAKRIRVRGHFKGKPALPDAKAARRAILYLLDTFPTLDAVVLIRDQDDEPVRVEGMNQARDQDDGAIAIVIGMAVVERESWVISGFDALDEPESARLDAARKELGFNPHETSHELTACKNDTAKRSPKRVLRALTGGDPERERRCWRDTALSILHDRGAHNGLADYLAEVRDRLAP